MRKLKRSELQGLLKTHVCDVFFLRRRPERAPGRPSHRQILCTNSPNILRSENGYRVLNYREPGPRKINTVRHNLAVTWDIMMQDWRNVSLDFCFLINKYPADEDFWKFFNEHIHSMSPNEKLRYMDTNLKLPS